MHCPVFRCRGGDSVRDCKAVYRLRQAYHRWKRSSFWTPVRSLQLPYIRTETILVHSLDYNVNDGYRCSHPCHPGRVRRFLHQLCGGCPSLDTALQPAIMYALPDPLFLERVFDFPSLPALRQKAEFADMAGTDPDHFGFRVLLALPTKGITSSTGNGGADLFWYYYGDRPGTSTDPAPYQPRWGGARTDRWDDHP